MTNPRAAAVYELVKREQREFARLHPGSLRAYEEGQQHFLYGAPSHWMRRWAGGFPLYCKSAHGAHVECVDGLQYVDFCLGDSGATLMMPTVESMVVGAELARRFGLPYWGFTTSASDANRALIRIARMITGRPKVLVFNGCYHGSVEEAHVALRDGQVVMRNGIHPNGVDHAMVSRVVEFNDVPALEEALAARDVAVVLAEPFMTNFGMVAPRPGYLDALREVTRRSGTLLAIDETHTFSSGPGGYTASHGLEPDFLVVGKSIGGGIPVGLYGTSEEVATQLWAAVPKVNPAMVRQSAHLGFGGTLAGSALQVSAVRAVLERVLTPEAFAHMSETALTLAAGMRAVVSRRRLPWSVVQLGARVELMFSAAPPVNAMEVAAGRDDAIEALLHVYFMNRGVLVTPFHCMLLMCPATTGGDVQRFISVLDDFCDEITRVAAPGTPA